MLFDPSSVAIESAHRIRTLTAAAAENRLATEALRAQKLARKAARRQAAAPGLRVPECVAVSPCPTAV